MASAFWARLLGQHRRAGEIYFRSGRLESAAAQFARAGDHLESARLWLRSGREKQALAMLEHVHPERAGELLSEEGLDKLALQAFEKAGSWWRAAECARRLQRPLRAARLFESAGALELAARAYAEAGDEAESLRVWGLLSQQLAELGNESERARVDEMRARRLASLGEIEKAAVILEGLGRWSTAARLWRRARRDDRAVVALLEAGRGLEAAELLESGSVELDAALKARVLTAVSRHEDAARAYEEAGDISGAMRQLEAAGAYAAAAERARERGELARAAELWLAGGEPAAAARTWAESGDVRRAVEVALSFGLNGLAAEFHRGEGDFLRAAQENIKADRAEDAIHDLQRIDAASADHASATRLLVPLLVGAGRYQPALEALDSLGPVADGDAAYWRARALEGLGRSQEALDAYRRLTAERPRHRDARDRLQALEAAAGTGAVDQQEFPVEVGDRLLGRFEIEAEIGRGGMSRVYRARDLRRQQLVAVKVMAPSYSAAEGAEERLVEEVRLCRRLRHPRLARVFEHGSVDGVLFVVMELLEGESLESLLARIGTLNERQAVELAAGLLEGLAAAHREKVVHRDLKPGNVFLTSTGPRILDFGIAGAIDEEQSMEAGAQVLGSPLFMSPEQIEGRPLDGRSDLYSLGVVLFTSLAGRPPFQGGTSAAIALKHLQDPPPDLQQLRPDVGRGLVRFVETLLAKTAGDRPPTAEVALEALRHRIDDE